MEIRKQDINVGKAVFEGDIKSGAEGSIIVPDIKPDILKVLQADAETFLTEKTIDNGRLVLKGKMNVNILYVPESEEDCIQCLKGCFEFCETIKNPEFAEDMQVIAFADATKVSYKLINSRKVGIDADITISVQVTGNLKCNVVCEISDENSEIQKNTISANSCVNYNEFTFKLDETIDFPDTKPGIFEILKSNLSIVEKETRALSGKIVVKGKVKIAILYTSEARLCEHIEFELPFTEVFDINGLTDESVCEVVFCPEEIEAMLSKGMSGEKQCISITSAIRVCIRTEECEEADVVTDCYFTNCNSELSFRDIISEKVAAKPALSCVLKEILEKGENQPEISGIYTAVAKPHITSTQIQNGKIAVSGKAVVYVLYTSQNGQNPVCSINEEIPFSYMIDCDKVSRGDDVFLEAECEHISCTINSPGTVEVRCGLCIGGKVVKKCIVKAVSDVTVSEPFEKDTSMIVYFVKDNDSIWDIGKYYHVKCEKILKTNTIEENAPLLPGEKLIIPVE